MNKKQLILIGLFFSLIAFFAVFLKKGRSACVSEIFSPKPIYSLVGSKIESKSFNNLIETLDFRIIESDQYVFLPAINTYEKIYTDFKPIYYYSEHVPMIIESSRNENDEYVVSTIFIGLYNNTGEKYYLDQNFLKWFDEKILNSGYYLPYEFLFVKDLNDAKRHLFFPYSTIIEEEYSDGFRLVQPKGHEPIKYPVVVWHDSGKIFSINFTNPQ